MAESLLQLWCFIPRARTLPVTLRDDLSHSGRQSCQSGYENFNKMQGRPTLTAPGLELRVEDRATQTTGSLRRAARVGPGDRTTSRLEATWMGNGDQHGGRCPR